MKVGSMTALPDAARFLRGLDVFKKGKVELISRGMWVVRSPGGTSAHMVTLDDLTDSLECSCPDHTQRHVTCKHMVAVELMVKSGDAK